jgi:hypothetical protein
MVKMRHALELLMAWFFLRTVRDEPASVDGIDPLEQLKLAREREKIEREERRALEERATLMLSVTVALAGLGIAGLRQLAKNDPGGDVLLAWTAGPIVYVIVTVFLLLRALTVRPPEPVTTPPGEGVRARLARAEKRSRAIAANNLKVVHRTRQATTAFSIGFLLLLAYATIVAIDTD